MLRRRREGILAREVVDDMLLLDTESGEIHQLNETASFIWRNCEEALSIEGLAAVLASAFDVSHDVATRDVAEALRRMRALNLLVEQ
jgi:coenzyme PQQ synthesis protein D (PqqD)